MLLLQALQVVLAGSQLHAQTLHLSFQLPVGALKLSHLMHVQRRGKAIEEKRIASRTGINTFLML